MARKKRTIPEINAGSMADIAFLLLIFFLVTTTIETDTGITVKLPAIPDGPPPVAEVNERNVLIVLVNSNNQLLVEGKPLPIERLKETAKEFIQNPNRRMDLAESPKDAVVSLKSDRGTKYETYVAIWNELTAAYNELKDEYSINKYGKPFDQLSETLQKEVKGLYPKLVSEAEPESFGGE